MWHTCELWLIQIFRNIAIPIDMTEPRSLLPFLINALTRITGISWQKQLFWAGEKKQNPILGHEKIYFLTIKSNSCGADQDWRPFLFGCGVDCRHYLQPSPDMNTWYFFRHRLNQPSVTPGKSNWQLVEISNTLDVTATLQFLMSAFIWTWKQVDYYSMHQLEQESHWETQNKNSSKQSFWSK